MDFQIRHAWSGASESAVASGGVTSRSCYTCRTTRIASWLIPGSRWRPCCGRGSGTSACRSPRGGSRSGGRMASAWSCSTASTRSHSRVTGPRSSRRPRTRCGSTRGQPARPGQRAGQAAYLVQRRNARHPPDPPGLPAALADGPAGDRIRPRPVQGHRRRRDLRIRGPCAPGARNSNSSCSDACSGRRRRGACPGTCT